MAIFNISKQVDAPIKTKTQRNVVEMHGCDPAAEVSGPPKVLHLRDIWAMVEERSGLSSPGRGGGCVIALGGRMPHGFACGAFFCA